LSNKTLIDAQYLSTALLKPSHGRCGGRERVEEAEPSAAGASEALEVPLDQALLDLTRGIGKLT
jgi:hypothetical protein